MRTFLMLVSCVYNLNFNRKKTINKTCFNDYSNFVKEQYFISVLLIKTHVNIIRQVKELISHISKMSIDFLFLFAGLVGE